MSENERKKRLGYRKIRKGWICVGAVILTLLLLVTVTLSALSMVYNKTYYVNYSERSSVDYGVHLKDNDFYEDSFLGKDYTYIAALIDKVEATFNYGVEVESEENVSFDYKYRLDAVIEIKDKNSGKIMFAPVYNEVAEKSGEANGKNVSIKETLAVDYNKYNSIAESFIKTYQLNYVVASLVLKMDVSVTGESAQFDANENTNTYTNSISIPLSSDTVEVKITSNIPKTNEGILSYTTKDTSILYANLAIKVGGVSLIVALILVAYIYLSRNIDITHEIRVKRILSAYRSFIQRIKNEFDTTGYQSLYLTTFKEMLEIRDTIGAPILMTENEDKTLAKFLIPTNTKLVYVFELKVDDYDEIYGTDPTPPTPEDPNPDTPVTEDELVIPCEPAVTEEISAEPVTAPTEPTPEAVAEEPSEEVTVEAPTEEVTVEAPAEEPSDEPIEETPVVEEVTEEIIPEEEPIAEEPIEEIIPEEEPIVAEEPAEEIIPAEEPIVADEPIEEIIPVEEPVAVEEPIEETPIVEEVTEEAPAENTEVNIFSLPFENIIEIENDDGDTTLSYIDEGGKVISIACTRSFTANLIQSNPQIKEYYDTLKNKILSYKGVKARTSWRNESYKKGRIQLFKLKIRGKTICLYCALNPDEFDKAKYFHEVSEAKNFAAVPMMVRIKSDRGLKRALSLVELVMQRFEIPENPKATQVNFTEEFPYDTTKNLVERQLIKLLFTGAVAAEPQPHHHIHKRRVEIAHDDVVDEVIIHEYNDEEITEEALIEIIEEPTPVLEEIDFDDASESTEEYIETPNHPGVDVIGVVWPERTKRNKIYRYDPDGEVVSVGDIVIVPTFDAHRGREVIRKAVVAHANHKVDPEELKFPIKKIVGVIHTKPHDTAEAK